VSPCNPHETVAQPPSTIMNSVLAPLDNILSACSSARLKEFEYVHSVKNLLSVSSINYMLCSKLFTGESTHVQVGMERDPELHIPV
jgi:hypothetical protein